MKNKNFTVVDQNTSPFDELRSENKHQIIEKYLKTRNKECEKYLSKFC